MMGKYFACWYFVAFIVVSQTRLTSSERAQKLPKAINCFTVDLFTNLSPGKPTMISSPYSAEVAMSMLLIGAGGITADELNRSLHYTSQGLSLTDVEKGYESQLKTFENTQGAVLNIANSMWIRESYVVKEAFKTSLQNYFNAVVSELDFSGNPSQSTEKINEWVKSKTNGLIPKLFGENLPSSTVLVLVNTVYFKGEWQYKFDPANTREEIFYENGNLNSQAKVPLMNIEAGFSYRDDNMLGAQVLEMNYKGGDMSMVILLPKTGNNLAQVEQKLTCNNLEDIIKVSGKTVVNVFLPKFEISSDYDLITPLQALGIQQVFTNSANLSGIANGIKVSQVIQKAVIKVSEEGSEAAAATAVVVVESSSIDGGSPQIIQFRADHPFLYVIKHKPTNTVIFIGKISEIKK